MSDRAEYMRLVDFVEARRSVGQPCDECREPMFGTIYGLTTRPSGAGKAFFVTCGRHTDYFNIAALDADPERVFPQGVADFYLQFAEADEWQNADINGSCQ